MKELSSLVSRLSIVPHFKNLSQSTLRDIVSSGQVKRVIEGTTLFLEGDPCAGLFVLLDGRVQLVKFGVEGQETIIAVIKPVIMFNEVAVLDGGPNPLTALAIKDCMLWQISQERYQMLMERIPELGTGLLRVLAARNRRMLEHIEDLMSLPVLARTAKILLDLSQFGAQTINRTAHPNREIASLVATVPGAISRSLKNLRESGAIHCTRGKITILDVDELAELAHIDPIIYEAPVPGKVSEALSEWRSI